MKRKGARDIAAQKREPRSCHAAARARDARQKLDRACETVFFKKHGFPSVCFAAHIKSLRELCTYYNPGPVFCQHGPLLFQAQPIEFAYCN